MRRIYLAGILFIFLKKGRSVSARASVETVYSNSFLMHRSPIQICLVHGWARSPSHFFERGKDIQAIASGVKVFTYATAQTSSVLSVICL